MQREPKDTSVQIEPFSRKREREISQEPPTPATPTLGVASLVGGEECSNGSAEPSRVSPRSKRRSPKKNRVGTCELDDTREEDADERAVGDVEGADHAEQDEDENQMVISVSGSPPHETKMRQISEGVGGIKMIKMGGSVVAATADQGEEEDVFVDAVEEPAGQAGPGSSQTAVLDVPTSTTLVEEGLPSSNRDPASDEAAAATEPSPSLRSSSSRTGSQSEDVDQDKMLKRKLCDRAVSESRESGSGGKKASRMGVGDIAPVTSTGAKRSREEEGGRDINLRESKRPSPPPEKEESTFNDEVGKSMPEASSSKVKLGGFMAYAGSSSPFTSAKGPNLSKSSSQSSTTATSESIKRPRDDADKDDNPRETKRPSPPPEQRAAEEQPQQPQHENEASGSSDGFLAFASISSPFAKVKGPNLFSSSNKSSSTSSSWSSGAISPFAASSSQEPTALKRSGFDGFASPSLPFTGVVRSKSPVGALGRSKSPSSRKMTSGVNKNSSAFSAYASSGVQGFSVSSVAVKRARAEDAADDGRRKRNSVDGGNGGAGTRSDESSEGSEEREKMSFGERLRAEKDDQGSGGSDDDGKVTLTEQEVHTGEEEEETIYQVRGKLFALSDQNQWREKGTGIIKLNLRKSDGGGARLVMRKDAVYTVILNTTLFKGMNCSYASQDQRYLKFSTFENGAATHYNLRLANAKIAGGLMEEVIAHIPT